jgi:selenocysteine-specific elongation factor
VGDRFVLREEGRGTTVAGGRVADVAPADPVRGRDAREAHDRALTAVIDSEGEARIAAMLELGGGVVDLDRLRGLDTGDALSRPGGPRRVGSVVVDAPIRRAWAETVRGLLARKEQADQTRLAVALVERGCPPDSVGAVLQALEHAGVVARRGPWFIAASAQDTFDADAQQRRESLLAALDVDPFQPPDLDDAVRASRATVQDVEALRADRRIVVHQGIAFTSTAVQIAIERLSQLERRHGPFTASVARQELGTTRKFAIPLLEILDGMGATVFDGALRTFRRS